MREIFEARRSETMTHGITPACAGKTKRTQYHAQSTRDHPRMCGKNLQTLRPMHLMPGSPPHVREKLATSLRGVPGSGITPACAGKTAGSLEFLCPLGDHPRMCGKNCKYLKAKELMFGITPACAGKTLSRQMKSAIRRDHPRMCGKNCWQFRIPLPLGGSPPHVREKL